MNLYSARRWLYIAETCSCPSPVDKVVFRLDLHYFLFTRNWRSVSVGGAHTGDVRPQYYQPARCYSSLPDTALNCARI